MPLFIDLRIECSVSTCCASIESNDSEDRMLDMLVAADSKGWLFGSSGKVLCPTCVSDFTSGRADSDDFVTAEEFMEKEKC